MSAHVQPARKLRQQRLCARSARGGKEKALHRKLCGEAHWGATYTCGRKCENALELQGGGGARRISRPVYSKCTGDHTGQKETALWARWGAHRECVEADA